MHWKGLLLLDLFERRLLGDMKTVDAKEIEGAAKLAADVFLRAYGPDQSAGPSRQRASGS